MEPLDSPAEPSKHLRPAKVCKALLAALEASEGQRRRRKRDQTPDGIGLTMKRELLACVVEEDPDPEAFEGWLLSYPLRSNAPATGGIAAMARAVLDEWRLAHSMGEFKAWLEKGAPSDDASPESARNPNSEGRG